MEAREKLINSLRKIACDLGYPDEDLKEFFHKEVRAKGKILIVVAGDEFKLIDNEKKPKTDYFHSHFSLCEAVNADNFLYVLKEAFVTIWADELKDWEFAICNEGEVFASCPPRKPNVFRKEKVSRQGGSFVNETHFLKTNGKTKRW